MPGYSMDYSRLRSRRKNGTAPGPPPQLLAFMCVALAPELSFFMATSSDVTTRKSSKKQQSQT